MANNSSKLKVHNIPIENLEYYSPTSVRLLVYHALITNRLLSLITILQLMIRSIFHDELTKNALISLEIQKRQH